MRTVVPGARSPLWPDRRLGRITLGEARVMRCALARINIGQPVRLCKIRIICSKGPREKSYFSFRATGRTNSCDSLTASLGEGRPEGEGFCAPMKTVIAEAATAAPPTTNKHLIRWVEKMAELTQPDRIHWVDGSQEEYDASLRRRWSKAARSSSSMRSCGRAASTPAPTPSDVARVEDRTFICSLSKDSGRPHQQLGRSLRDAHAS